MFVKINEAFINRFNDQKPHIDCKNCSIYSQSCKHFPKEPTQKLPPECLFRFWQEGCLHKLENEISKSIYEKIVEINKQREKYHCKKCATCCRLASSEFSYEELKERAKNGDIFSQQFVSIFVPYENKEDARKIYPEFFELLEEKYKEDRMCLQQKNKKR